MNIPVDLKYAKTDEWVRVEGDTAAVGITDYAQSQLSDIVFVELPDIGKSFKQGEPFGSVESVKAANDLYLPLSGAITEVNTVLTASPEWVNSDPYGKAWMVKFKIANTAELANLLDAAAYQKHCEARAH